MSAVPPPARTLSYRAHRESRTPDVLFGRQAFWPLNYVCVEEGVGIEPTEACARAALAERCSTAEHPFHFLQSSSWESNPILRVTKAVLGHRATRANWRGSSRRGPRRSLSASFHRYPTSRQVTVILARPCTLGASGIGCQFDPCVHRGSSRRLDITLSVTVERSNIRDKGLEPFSSACRAGALS